MTSNNDGTVRLSAGNWIAMLSIVASTLAAGIGAAWRFTDQITGDVRVLQVQVGVLQAQVGRLESDVDTIKRRVGNGRLAHQ